MRIEIKSTDLRNKSGISKKTGKAYSFNIQTGYVQLDKEPYPVRCNVTLFDDSPALAVGYYDRVVDYSYVDKFGEIETKFKLVPVVAK